jgi:hypothetical protein
MKNIWQKALSYSTTNREKNQEKNSLHIVFSCDMI